MLLNNIPYSKLELLSISGYSTLFCCSTATFCWLLNLQLQKRKQYRQISSAKIYSIKEIVDLLQEQQSESQNPTTTLSILHKEFKQFFEHPKEQTDKIISKPIFVEGKIEINDDLYYPSKFSPNEKLVVQQTEKHQLYSNRKFITKRQKFLLNSQRKIAKKFLITDDNDSENKCEVHLPKNQTFFDGIIKCIGEKKIKFPMTNKLKFKKVCSLVFHILTRIASFGLLQIKGLKIGYIEKEFGLTVNTGLIFYTKVGFNLKTKKMKIKNPLAIMTEKCQFLKTLRFNMNLWVFPLVASASFSLFFFIKLIKLRQAYLKKVVDENENIYDDDQLNNLNDDIKCIICFGAPRTLIFEPCKHLVMCRGCYEHLQRKECPICKQYIQGYYEIKMRRR